MIKKVFYKDRPAFMLSNGKLSVVVLPEDGGKIASLMYDGQELCAQRPGNHYLRLSAHASYVEGECSGFDDMFPTIDPCSLESFEYPDHGEVSRTSLNAEVHEDQLQLRCEVKSVNCTFEKTVFFQGDCLCVRYHIQNHNAVELPYIWAGHLMIAGEEGARVVSEYSYENVTVCFGTPPKESIHVLEAKGENKEYKFYFDEAKQNTFCSVILPRSKRKIEFAFEGDIVKYLAVWMNPGDLNGMYNLAVEPCSAPYDSPVKAGDKCSFIKPHHEVAFIMKIKVGGTDHE